MGLSSRTEGMQAGNGSQEGLEASLIYARGQARRWKLSFLHALPPKKAKTKPENMLRTNILPLSEINLNVRFVSFVICCAQLQKESLINLELKGRCGLSNLF